MGELWSRPVLKFCPAAEKILSRASKIYPRGSNFPLFRKNLAGRWIKFEYWWIKILDAWRKFAHERGIFVDAGVKFHCSRTGWGDEMPKGPGYENRFSF